MTVEDRIIEAAKKRKTGRSAGWTMPPVLYIGVEEFWGFAKRTNARIDAGERITAHTEFGTVIVTP